DHPELVLALIKKGTVDSTIAQHVLSQPHWKDHPELVLALIKRGTVDGWIATYALSQPHWKDHSELRALMNGEEPTVARLRSALRQGKTPDCLRAFGFLGR
ncbi:MAG: hypothetical protein RJB38_810, partial [Pseudomonadota bacterium]